MKMKQIAGSLGGLLIAALPAGLFAQSGAYVLSGKLAPLPATAKAYLYYGGKTDSAAIANGTFAFKGAVETPQKTYLIVNPRGTGIRAAGLQMTELYLEPGKISVSSRDSLANAVVSGGPVNSDNIRLKKALEPVNQKMEALQREYEAAGDEKRKSKEFSDDINKRYESLMDEQKKGYLAFIKSNPSSLVSLFSIKEYGGAVPDVAEVEPLYNSLSEKVKTSKAGVDYAASIAKMKKTAVGAIAPDFTMADTSGKEVSLHDFKGKYVLVDFWASWCGPCRAENPNVVKAYSTYRTKGFNILGVSLDQPNAKDRWMKAIHDDGLTWTQVSDLKGWKNEAAQLYGVQAIPQNFLISPDGKIVAKNIRGEELQTKLSELFGSNQTGG